MDIVELKVLAAFLFLLLALFFGLTPFLLLLRLAKSEDSKSQHPLIQHLHSLASGVLLATCLLHLLPESLQAVRDAIASASRSRNALGNDSITDTGQEPSNTIIDTDGLYPVAELMVALGFLFIYCVYTTFKTWRTSEKHNRSSETDLEMTSGWGSEDRNSSHERFFEDSSDGAKLLSKSAAGKSRYRLRNGNDSSSAIKRGTGYEGDEEESLHQLSHFHRVPSNHPSESEEIHPLAEGQQSIQRASDKSDSRVRSLALVAALCIHGFFDGVILGLQTNTRLLLSLLLALSLHKSFVAISLSLTLLNNRRPDGQGGYCIDAVETLSVLLFSSVAPLGLALSSVFVHTTFDFTKGDDVNDSDVSVLPGCLQAFAVGTFLYVTFFELAEHSHGRELRSSDDRRKSVLRVLVSHIFLGLGFAFMAWLRAALGDS